MFKGNAVARWAFRLVLPVALIVAAGASSYAGMSGGRISGVTLETAAATAHQALDGCSSSTGKALYDCIGRVLLNFCGNISHSGAPQVDTTLRAAAAGLRAAVNKVQALSAIALAQSAVASALRQVRTLASNAPLAGWGAGSGLSAVASVLAHAAKLIQTKG